MTSNNPGTVCPDKHAAAEGATPLQPRWAGVPSVKVRSVDNAALPTLSSHRAVQASHAAAAAPNHLAAAPTTTQTVPSAPSTSALSSPADPVTPTQKHPQADSADSEHDVNDKVTSLTDGE